MKNQDNIEKKFKESFDRFEADVNPQVWTNVQAGIKSASGSAASAGSKLAIGKIIVGVTSAVVLSGSIWYFSSSSKKPVIIEEQQIRIENVSPNVGVPINTAEEKSAKEISYTNRNGAIPPSVTSNRAAENTTEQTKISTGPNDHVASSDESISNDHTSAPDLAAKYGNASHGDGGMVRGNQNAPTTSAGTNTMASADSQEEDAYVPTATIFANVISGDAPLTVNFMNQGFASSLLWEFGDGSTSRESTPSHTFNEPGNYVVVLTAKNSSGNISDRINIEVRPISSITNIPNIFTPNGDGDNDHFFFEMKNIASVGVAIYSQKEGKQIYTWNTIDGKWNGKLMNGQDAPEGVYLYSIQANGMDGVLHSKKGFVNLSIKR